MKIDIAHQFTLASDATIVAASLSALDEYVLLLGSGEVIRQPMNAPTGTHLFSVNTGMGYADGGFDISSPASIYTLDDIVVVVNDYKRHGFIHYPGKYPALHLWREDYHADISRYPIALYRDQQAVPHIVYGVAWNHVQIMNLDTRQVLTAAKSLIEEGAEEKHLAFYEKYEEANKLPWPSTYDYFYGGLQMSPDNSKFLSAGWGWGSCDWYKIYEVTHFISSHRIADKAINSWEHYNRGVCWINNTTVAVTYHPVRDEEEEAAPDAPCEIHFYKVDGDDAAIIKKIKIAGIDILNITLHYNEQLQIMILFNDNVGLVIISPEGEILINDPAIKVTTYCAAANSLLCVAGKTVTVYRLSL